MSGLRQRQVMHMSLSRGGYAFGYKIIDATGKTVADKSIHCAKAGAKEVIVYTLGDDQFSTADEFFEAYKLKVETERRDQEWEAAAPC